MNNDRWQQPFLCRATRAAVVAARSIVEIVPPKDSIYVIDRVAADVASFAIFSPSTLIDANGADFLAQALNPLNIITVGRTGTSAGAVPPTAMGLNALETMLPHAWIMHSKYIGRLIIITSAQNVTLNCDISARYFPQDYPLDDIMRQV